MEELLGGRGESKLLRLSFKGRPRLQDLLFCGLVCKLHEHRRRVAVRNGHAQALRRDDGPRCRNDRVAFDAAPDFEGLLFALFLFAADVGDDVIDDLGHRFERLACPRDRLIGADGAALDAELLQRMKKGDIGLQRTVALDGDKAALGPEALSLRRNDPEMFGVDFGDDHGNVGRETVRRIVGDDGDLELCIRFLEGADLLLLHIDGAEHEIDFAYKALCIRRRVEDDHLLRIGGDGAGHRPFMADRFFIGLARGARACEQGDGGEPGMAFEQRHEALTDHSRSADDGDTIV